MYDQTTRQELNCRKPCKIMQTFYLYLITGCYLPEDKWNISKYITYNKYVLKISIQLTAVLSDGTY